MMLGIKMIANFLRLFRRKEDGGPTIEFVLVFMPFMVITISGFELGLLMTRHVMMERGVDIAVRGVRLNTSVAISEDDFKREICNGAGLLGDDCMTKVRVEIIALDMRVQNGVSASTIPREASCTDVDQPFLPARNFVTGVPNEMMVVRVCGLFTPMLPEFGLGYFLSRMRPDGYYPLVSTTAFVMEPV